MPLKSHPKTHKSMHFALVSAIREIAVNTVLELTNILKDMKQTFSDYKYHSSRSNTKFDVNLVKLI